MAPDADALHRASQEELRASFDTFDLDGDGHLSAEELAAALSALGQVLGLDEARRLVASVDLNHDGVVDFDEFRALVEPRPEGEDPSADADEAFAVLDTDGDGFLTADEIAAALRRGGDRVSDAEIARIVAAADADGDGRVSLGEFRRILGL
jgi:calcium-binding protein CML